MVHDNQFLLDIISILAVAVISVAVFKRMKLESVLGYLIAGVLVGPYSIGLVSDVETIGSIAELGVVFLLFTIGLELPIERLKVLGASVYILGIAQIAFTTLVVTIIAVAAGLDINVAIMVGATISLSSTVFVIQLLIDRGELATRLGRTAFSVLLIQDLAVGPLLIYVVVLGDTSMPLGHTLLIAAGKAALVLVAILVIGRVILRPLFRVAAITRNAEVFAAATLLVILCTAILTDLAGLSLALGGLLAGILLSETEYRHQVAAEIQSFRGLFVGLFFMAVGMSIDLKLALDNLAVVMLLAGAIVFGKALVLSITALAFGHPRRIAIPLGSLLAQGGEFAFVIFGIAMIQGVLSRDIGQTLIVAIIVTMMLSPFLASLSGIVSRRISHSAEIGYEQASEAASDQQGHVLIAGYGRVGRAIGTRLQSQKIPIIGVDLDPDRVKSARQQGDPVWFGDATRPEVLDALNIASARAVVVALRDPNAAIQLVGLVHYLFPELQIYARAYDDEHAKILEEAGAVVVVPELVATGNRLARAILDAAE